MSDLLREIVRRELARREQELEAKKRQWLEGLERIEQRKQEMLARRGGKPIDIDVVQLINEARDERIDQILGIDRELSD
jgi:7,8-dihydro-6-hydroxymethylpterin-pyrophosphokinase